MELVYKCEYCSRTSKTEMGMKIHESECPFNPETRSCRTCKLADDSANYPMCEVIICPVDHKDAHECPHHKFCSFWEKAI